jgi:PAS domain S-box-containing protein
LIRGSRQANEVTLRQIVDRISAPLAVMTPGGALEIINRPILEYFGKTAEELKEWTSTDAVHPDDLSASRVCMEAVNRERCSSVNGWWTINPA